jgi:AmiR/NasT family two-component response regulator
MEDIKNILMRRDGMTETEANDAIAEAKEAMNEYLEMGDMEAAYEVCAEYFGLEPDYLMELI